MEREMASRLMQAEGRAKVGHLKLNSISTTSSLPVGYERNMKMGRLRGNYSFSNKGIRAITDPLEGGKMPALAVHMLTRATHWGQSWAPYPCVLLMIHAFVMECPTASGSL